MSDPNATLYDGTRDESQLQSQNENDGCERVMDLETSIQLDDETEEEGDEEGDDEGDGDDRDDRDDGDDGDNEYDGDDERHRSAKRLCRHERPTYESSYSPPIWSKSPYHILHQLRILRNMTKASRIQDKKSLLDSHHQIQQLEFTVKTLQTTVDNQKQEIETQRQLLWSLDDHHRTSIIEIEDNLSSVELVFGDDYKLTHDMLSTFEERLRK